MSWSREKKVILAKERDLVNREPTWNHRLSKQERWRRQSPDPLKTSVDNMGEEGPPSLEYIQAKDLFPQKELVKEDDSLQ
ncbi:myotubularin-related protein 4 isoform X1, partial [Clarias magur]